MTLFRTIVTSVYPCVRLLRFANGILAMEMIAQKNPPPRHAIAVLTMHFMISVGLWFLINEIVCHQLHFMASVALGILLFEPHFRITLFRFPMTGLRYLMLITPAIHIRRHALATLTLLRHARALTRRNGLCNGRAGGRGNSGRAARWLADTTWSIAQLLRLRMRDGNGTVLQILTMRQMILLSSPGDVHGVLLHLAAHRQGCTKKAKQNPVPDK